MLAETLTVILDVAQRVVSDPESGVRRSYYSGTITSDLVKLLTFVPVRENSKKTYLMEQVVDGYQRPSSAIRMRLFGDFVKQNPLSVVPPVMLSSRGQWVFDRDKRCLLAKAPAAIIDGQHRIGGYAYLFEKDQIPRGIEFILLPDLSRDEEIDEFLTINTTQKGVPKSLGVLLEGIRGRSEDALVALELDDRPDSPFHNHIRQVQQKKGDLFSLATVEKNVGRTFEYGALQYIDIDQKVNIMCQYWNMIADHFPEEWQDIERDPRDQVFKLLETTGLIAWSLVAAHILGPAFDSVTRNVDWDKVERSIKKLAIPGALDWRKNGEFQGLTGEVGGRRICKKMEYYLSMKLADDGEGMIDGRWLRRVAEQ